MKKIASVAISIVLLAVSFGLVSCGEMKDTQVYGADVDKTYFTASFVVSQPSVKEKDFTFPVVTKDPVKEVTELKFFNGKRDLKIQVDSIVINRRYPYIQGDSATTVKTNDYRYAIEAKLNIFEITDPIKIDSITMKINGYEKRFQVDITITYKYIDYETHPDVFIIAPSGVIDTETVPGGVSVLYCPIKVRRHTVFHSLQFRSIPASPVSVMIRKDDGAPVSCDDGTVLEVGTRYSFIVSVENSKLDQFYDEGLNISVTAEGMHDMTLYGDLDKLDTDLFYFILADAENIFFS